MRLGCIEDIMPVGLVVSCPELSTVSIPRPSILGIIKLKAVLAVRQANARSHIAQCLLRKAIKRTTILV